MAGIPTQTLNGAPAVLDAQTARGPARPNPASVPAAPPRQRPYDQALQRGFDALCAAPLSPERLRSLGATMGTDTVRLPALNRMLLVDPGRRRVAVDDAGPARSAWAVLAVHYLCADDVAPDPCAVSFSHFQDCRSYLSVFGKRIIGRFLATAGRTAPPFIRLAEALGGTRVPGPGTGYRFDVFPRVPITIVRYEGDDELGPGASVIYRADAERLLPAEDRVVAAELLLDLLSGKPIAEDEGSHA